MPNDIIHSRYSFEEFTEMIEQMYEGFIISDIEGRVLYANKAVEEISGFSREDIVGKTPKEMEKEGLIVKQTYRILPKSPITIVQQLKNGKEVLLTSKPVYDSDGRIICFVVNYTNLASLNHFKTLHNEKLKMNVNKKKSLEETDDWVGESFETHQLKEKVAKIAQTEATVLIIGESGVGKEIVATYLHKLSYRNKKPFIPINCGALPKELIESELFGYEKGAFTGAYTSKSGLFESANGGTIFLDEIGEMPLDLQVRLLRVLQTKKITRIGGTKEIGLDVRIIAATNKDLEESVKKGEFREDLYYRLNVIPIHVSPLHERKDDIIPLSLYFLDKYNKKYKLNKIFSAETLQLFQEYHWPGNVRQLKNMIERLVIIAEEDEIAPKYLPPEFKGKYTVETTNIKSLSEAREEAEIRIIRLALKKYGSIRQAAKHLKVDHSTIVRKMKKYSIS